MVGAVVSIAIRSKLAGGEELASQSHSHSLALACRLHVEVELVLTQTQGVLSPKLLPSQMHFLLKITTLRIVFRRR
jgi:hypothetical protein